MPRPAFSKSSCQAQLQRMLGEHGEVLPRQVQGTADHPAAGWYARMNTGKLVYLGDHTGIAFATIAQLCQEAAA